MSATLASPSKFPNSAGKSAPPRAFLVGLGVSSFAALLLELALTRLFSVVLFYHFAFLAISIALLGLGAGGVFAYLAKQWLRRFKTRALAGLLCILNALLVPVVLEVVLHVPVSLALTRGNFLRLTTIYLVSALPFFLTGIQFSVVFARETHDISRLYGADLAGGALACLAIVPLLNWLGGPNTILFAALMAALAGAVWASRMSRKAAFLVALAVAALIAANHSGNLIDVIYAKGMFRDKSWVEFARWNAISRVEVDRQGGAKAIVIDADASTYIMNADPKQWTGTEWEKNLMSAPPALANVLRPHGEFAIIGPGGGVDVLRAVANGSPSVTGIEINSIIATTIMRGRYADYAYHLYERPDVHIHVTDGRSYLRGTEERFDVVQMTLVDTWASTAAGAFALSENNLYTVDAFREYFEHLRPDGMIAITRWEFRQPREALRVVSVAMEALHQLGVADPAKHLIVVSEGNLDEDGRPVVVLAKKTAFTAEEEQSVESHLSKYPKLAVLYLPSQPGSNPFSELVASNDPYAFARRYAYNVAPVDDNAPFFFFTLKLGQVLHGQGHAHGIDWKVNLGVAVLGMVRHHLRGRCAAVSRRSPAAKARAEAEAPDWPPIFRGRGSGLHPGRDRLHSALRPVPGTSHLCPDRGGLPAASFQWDGQPVFVPLDKGPRAPSHRRDLSRVDAVRICLARPSALGRRAGVPDKADGQCYRPSSPWSRHGDAISQRVAGFGPLPRSRPGQCCGMGMGLECGLQRDGIGAGHGHRYPIRAECDPGLRRGGLRHCLAHPRKAARSTSLTSARLL